MNRSRFIALCATVLAALLIVLTLSVCHLTFDASALNPSRQPVAEVAELDEEFVEFIDTRMAVSTPSEAYHPEPANNKSVSADASGADLKDAGAKGVALPDVVSDRPSPVQKPKKEVKAPAGPSKEEIEEQARRKVQKGVVDAFAPKDNAANNTDNKGKTPGDSGKPTGSESSVNGTGTGSVDGGWVMPRFAKVNSALTGSVQLKAIVGKDGKVISVEQTGGKAPAGTDAALVAKCIAEVRSRTFTRSDNDAPTRATARITYTFR